MPEFISPEDWAKMSYEEKQVIMDKRGPRGGGGRGGGAGGRGGFGGRRDRQDAGTYVSPEDWAKMSYEEKQAAKMKRGF